MKVFAALMVATFLSVTFGGLVGWLNGSFPPPAWPPSVALLNWPTGSWVSLFIPVAVIYMICLFAALRKS